MNKSIKILFSFMLLIITSVLFVACGNKTPMNNKKDEISEKISLSTAMLGEVEFANAETVELKQEGETVTISGKIDAMSASQKNAYGVEDITHVVTTKIVFDKERTLKTFKIVGNTTKVYSSDNSEEGYVGSLTDLLDSEEGEDAYCNLILSAQTKSYTLKTIYTDNTERTITVKIEATLASATIE